MSADDILLGLGLVLVAAAAALLFDNLRQGVPLLIGAVLVVSGPTVVLPLLAFVRPSHRVRTLLMFVVTPNGSRRVAADGTGPEVDGGDTVIALAAAHGHGAGQTRAGGVIRSG
jgi:hypothetical protein